MTINVHLHLWNRDQMDAEEGDVDEPIDLDLASTGCEVNEELIQIGTHSEKGVEIPKGRYHLEGRIYFSDIPEMIREFLEYFKAHPEELATVIRHNEDGSYAGYEEGVPHEVILQQIRDLLDEK
jgi:hypothetical protein